MSQKTVSEGYNGSKIDPEVIRLIEETETKGLDTEIEVNNDILVETLNDNYLSLWDIVGAVNGLIGELGGEASPNVSQMSQNDPHNVPKVVDLSQKADQYPPNPPTQILSRPPSRAPLSRPNSQIGSGRPQSAALADWLNLELGDNVGAQPPTMSQMSQNVAVNYDLDVETGRNNRFEHRIDVFLWNRFGRQEWSRPSTPLVEEEVQVQEFVGEGEGLSFGGVEGDGVDGVGEESNEPPIDSSTNPPKSPQPPKKRSSKAKNVPKMPSKGPKLAPGGALMSPKYPDRVQSFGLVYKIAPSTISYSLRRLPRHPSQRDQNWLNFSNRALLEDILPPNVGGIGGLKDPFWALLGYKLGSNVPQNPPFDPLFNFLGVVDGVLGGVEWGDWGKWFIYTLQRNTIWSNWQLGAAKEVFKKQIVPTFNLPHVCGAPLCGYVDGVYRPLPTLFPLPSKYSHQLTPKLAQQNPKSTAKCPKMSQIEPLRVDGLPSDPIINTLLKAQMDQIALSNLKYGSKKGGGVEMTLEEEFEALDYTKREKAKNKKMSQKMSQNTSQKGEQMSQKGSVTRPKGPDRYPEIVDATQIRPILVPFDGSRAMGGMRDLHQIIDSEWYSTQGSAFALDFVSRVCAVSPVVSPGTQSGVSDAQNVPKDGQFGTFEIPPYPTLGHSGCRSNISFCPPSPDTPPLPTPKLSFPHIPTIPNSIIEHLSTSPKMSQKPISGAHYWDILGGIETNLGHFGTSEEADWSFETPTPQSIPTATFVLPPPTNPSPTTTVPSDLVEEKDRVPPILLAPTPTANAIQSMPTCSTDATELYYYPLQCPAHLRLALFAIDYLFKNVPKSFQMDVSEPLPTLNRINAYQLVVGLTYICSSADLEPSWLSDSILLGLFRANCHCAKGEKSKESAEETETWSPEGCDKLCKARTVHRRATNGESVCLENVRFTVADGTRITIELIE